MSSYQDARTATRIETIHIQMVRCDYCGAKRESTYDITNDKDPMSPGWGRTLLYGDREPCDVCPACVARLGLKANA